MPGPTLDRLLMALEFAAHKHRDQRRKNVQASPYINHPIALASVLVREAGVTDLDVLCAALLHDTVEDTDTRAEELTEVFGATVSGIVMEVTDDKALNKAERKSRQISHAPELSQPARLVKLADKICNLRDMNDQPPAGWGLDRRREYFDWAKAVIDQIRGSHSGLETLFDQAYAARP